MGEQAAEGIDQDALFGVGGGVEDYQEARQGGKEIVKIYLSFGNQDFVESDRRNCCRHVRSEFIKRKHL